MGYIEIKKIRGEVTLSLYRHSLKIEDREAEQGFHRLGHGHIVSISYDPLTCKQIPNPLTIHTRGNGVSTYTYCRTFDIYGREDKPFINTYTQAKSGELISTGSIYLPKSVSNKNIQELLLFKDSMFDNCNGMFLL